MGQSVYKRISAKHTEDREKMVNARHPKLYNKISPKKLVTDDESYVLINVPETPGREFFHGKYISQVKTEAKLKCFYKFLKKFPIWLASKCMVIKWQFDFEK